MPALDLITTTAQFIREQMSGEGSGHDWWHVERVWRMARRIASEEQGADSELVELAALLHDWKDWKFAAGDEEAGPRAARAWLVEQGLSAERAEAVAQIIAEVSFKGAGVATVPSSLEGMIVQDADRLDAIGAIGIARAFSYGGYKGRPLHDPTVPPTLHATFGEYKKNAGPTLNHFYEKLLLLKERMHTATARRLADARHVRMENYLTHFLAEWDGTE